MSKRFPKPEITLDGIYSKFADDDFCKDFLLDIRFENGFACPFCGGSECRRIRTRHTKGVVAFVPFYMPNIRTIIL